MSSDPCSECDGYEVVIVDGEEVHCQTCSLRAEVQRLRAELAAERTANRITESHNHFDCAAHMARLRAAGDALAEALRAMTRLAAPPDMNEWVTWQLSVADPALTTYQEARREQ